MLIREAPLTVDTLLLIYSQQVFNHTVFLFVTVYTALTSGVVVTVSVDVKDCRGQGGDCTSTSTDCPANLRVLADDCNNYEVCCVRV